MTNFLRTIVVAATVTAVGACGNKDKTVAPPVADVLAQDTSLELAPTPSSDPYLGPQDVLAVAAPATGAEAAAAGAAAPGGSGTTGTSASKPPAAASRNTSLASAPGKWSRPRTRAERSRARRVVVSSDRSIRAVTSGAKKRSRSSERVIAARDAGATDVGARSTNTRAAETSPSAVVPRESARSTTPTAARQIPVIAAGSQLALKAEDRVCTNSASVGDRFETVLVEQVRGANGAVIPKGATAVALVSSVRRSGAQSGQPFAFQIESISFNGDTYALQTTVTDAEFVNVRSSSRSGNLGKVAAGSVLGAGIGRVIGRNTRSTVIGAAGGAAAGAVLAGRSTSYNSCVPDGGRITARLTEPLELAAD